MPFTYTFPFVFDPQTVSAITGSNLSLWLDDAGGTPRDVSGSSNLVSIARSIAVSEEIRQFGSDYPTRHAYGEDAALSVRAIYSEDESEAKQVFADWYENHYDDARTLRIDVPDSAVGSDRYLFEVLLAELNMSLESGSADPVLVEATLAPTGTFSVSEIAS